MYVKDCDNIYAAYCHFHVPGIMLLFWAGGSLESSSNVKQKNVMNSTYDDIDTFS